MSLSSWLLISILLFGFKGSSDTVSFSNTVCQIKAEAKTTVSEENSTKVEIIVNQKKTKSTKFYFYNSNKELVSTDFESNSISGLKPGTYYCFVVVNRECHTKVSFSI